MANDLPVPEGHVVHLIQTADPRAAAPPDLRLAPPLSRTTRAWLAVGLALAAVVATGALVLLWASASESWWFVLLFTVMLGAFVLGGWALLRAAIASGRERERAGARWLELRTRARPVGARVQDRTVRTDERGTVSGFELTVRTDGGDVLRGAWTHPSSETILQPQVPGTGARARVWRADGTTASDPFVIEVADPTVVTADPTADPAAPPATD